MKPEKDLFLAIRSKAGDEGTNLRALSVPDLLSRNGIGPASARTRPILTAERDSASGQKKHMLMLVRSIHAISRSEFEVDARPHDVDIAVQGVGVSVAR